MFRQYFGAVSGYVRRRVDPAHVDDLVDEVFLVAWRRFDELPAEPLGWLLRVAHNVCGTHIRGSRRGRALTQRLQLERERYAEIGEPDGEALAALAALPAADREVLLLVGWEGLTPAQAAVVIGCGASAIRMRLLRARRRFALQLASHLEGRADAKPVSTAKPANTKEAPSV